MNNARVFRGTASVAGSHAHFRVHISECRDQTPLKSYDSWSNLTLKPPKTAARVTIDAIVPVKPLSEAKDRLSGALDPGDRRHLVIEMLNHVLAALGSSSRIRNIFLVTRDNNVQEIAKSHECCLIDEPAPTSGSAASSGGCDSLDPSLNRAIHFGIASATSEGAGACLVLPADLPCVTADEINALCALLDDMPASDIGSVLICPDTNQDGGTNALLLSPPTVIPPSFGKHSASRHESLARDRGAEIKICHLEGFALDIDTPDDYLTLLEERDWTGTSLPAQGRA